MGTVHLYHSLSHKGLLKCVKDCINEQVQETVLTDKCGVPAGAFLGTPSMYLKSTLVGWKEGAYEQKSGIRTRSFVTPIRSDLHLSKIVKHLEDSLGNCIIKVFRYMDDYLTSF